MTKVKNVGSNMTLLIRDNAKILFSYETPVAVYDVDEAEFYKTDVKYSMTTTRHINKWLDGENATVVPQAVIDSYCN